MRLATLTTALILASATGIGAAFADDVKLDTTMAVNGIETACTGASMETRDDPQWQAYSLKIEHVGKDGQFLGNEDVNVTGNGKAVSVHCEGPWVLMKLPRGSYRVSTNVAQAGSKEITASVGSSGQRDVMMRFPNAGGEITNAIQLPGPQASE